MDVLETLKAVLDDNLALGGRARGFTPATPLFGSLPELDSFAVVGLVAALEQRFGVAIADAEINQQNFATVGGLAGLMERLQASAKR